MKHEELKAWLNARPEETLRAEALVIASRAALRVLPVCVEAFESDQSRKAALKLTFHCFRACLGRKLINPLAVSVAE